MAFESFAFDRVRFNTSTTGTGTITVGPAVSGFRTPAGASVPDGTKLSLFIFDGGDWEDATGIYAASGTTLTRTLRYSSTGALLNLSGSATVVVTPGKDDFDYILKQDGTNGNAFIAGGGNFSTTGSYNIGVGAAVMPALTSGINNVGLGVFSLLGATTGSHNMAIGTYALTAAVGATANVAIGVVALAALVSGNGNVAIGYSSLTAATASYNTGIGVNAGAQISSGAQNTIIGASVDGANGPTTGSNNILIGYDVDLPSNTASDQIGIGNIIFGTGVNGTGTTYNGKIGIGAPAPDRRFHVEEETATTNAVTYLFKVTSLSSGTPAVNIGAGMEFEIETAAGNNEVGATIEAKATAVGAGAEAIVLDGKQMAAGALQESFGVSPIIKTLAANAAYTSGTSAQPWFPSGGAVSLEASTAYEFEGHLLVATTGATTTHTMGISFGGTATLTSIAYRADAHHAAANTTQPTSTAALSNAIAVEQATNTVVTGLSGTTSGLRTSIWVRGIIRVNAAGTVIPQFTFSAARGAGNVLLNTFFKLRKIGSNTVVNQGPWA